MEIKICGMRDPENIRAVAALGPDCMGFIFYDGSPRDAGALPHEVIHALPGSIRRVGVFVDAAEETIIRTAVAYRLDFAQLHGDESPETCRRIGRILPVIKAIPIRTADDLAAASRYDGACRLLLFDTKTDRRGGSGMKFDWSILETYTGHTPFLLSGGIAPEDAEAIRGLRHPLLAGIDLNSRFEQEPGVKNTELLQSFMTQIKNRLR